MSHSYELTFHCRLRQSENAPDRRHHWKDVNLFKVGSELSLPFRFY